MVRQDGAVDGEQGLLAWKTDCEGCEMALEKNEINIRLVFSTEILLKMRLISGYCNVTTERL